jgi:hypothetical protein
LINGGFPLNFVHHNTLRARSTRGLTIEADRREPMTEISPPAARLHVDKPAAVADNLN